MVRSLWAWSATASAACVAPAVKLPGGKPVIALPGLTPRLPKIVVGLVLVTVWPPRTAKLAAEPSPGAVCAPGLAMAPAAERSVANRTIRTSVVSRGNRNIEHSLIFRVHIDSRCCLPVGAVTMRPFGHSSLAPPPGEATPPERQY